MELFDPERLPAFHDPFAGGGSIPLEAQRLGLETHASDLNPRPRAVPTETADLPAPKEAVGAIYFEGNVLPGRSSLVET